MNYHRNNYCSASGMFVFNSIPSFMEFWRNYIYGFMQRLNNSDNTVVAATVSSCLNWVIPDIRYNFGYEMTRKQNSFIEISFTISLCSTYSSISI